MSCWRKAAISGFVRLPTVFARAIAQNRSGACTAAPTAAQPPIDCATSAARAIPRWSSNAMASVASAAGPGPPATSGDWPKPRWSTVTHRYSSANTGTCCHQLK